MLTPALPHLGIRFPFVRIGIQRLLIVFYAACVREHAFLFCCSCRALPCVSLPFVCQYLCSCCSCFSCLCIALRCMSLHGTAMLRMALFCFALLRIASHCFLVLLLRIFYASTAVGGRAPHQGRTSPDGGPGPHDGEMTAAEGAPPQAAYAAMRHKRPRTAPRSAHHSRPLLWSLTPGSVRTSSTDSEA